jgi:hypothetical protein
MINTLEKLLDEIPEDMSGKNATPAANNHLFQVNEDTDNLDEEPAQLFHHNVAKLLFLCKWARPDLQTALAFLTARVQQPDIDYYKKL